MIAAMKIVMGQKLTWSEEVGDDNLGHSLHSLMFPRYGYVDMDMYLRTFEYLIDAMKITVRQKLTWSEEAGGDVPLILINGFWTWIWILGNEHMM